MIVIVGIVSLSFRIIGGDVGNGGGELQGWYEGIVWGGEGWWIVTKAITLKHLSRKSLDCVLFLFQWRKHKLCLSEPVN